jgi:hypothetical protein
LGRAVADFVFLILALSLDFNLGLVAVLDPRTPQSSPRSLPQNDLEYPKQPETSYFAFRAVHQKAVRDELAAASGRNGAPVPMKEVADVLGTRWKALSEAEKHEWESKAEASRKEYEKKIEAWKKKHPNTPLEVPADEIEKWATWKEPRGQKRKNIGEGEHEEEEENLEEDIGTPEPVVAKGTGMDKEKVKTKAKSPESEPAVEEEKEEEDSEDERKRRKAEKKAAKEAKKAKK